MGEALVTNENGNAKIFAFDTTEKGINLIILPIRLEQFECTTKRVRVINKNEPITKEQETDERITELT